MVSVGWASAVVLCVAVVVALVALGSPVCLLVAPVALVLCLSGGSDQCVSLAGKGVWVVPWVVVSVGLLGSLGLLRLPIRGFVLPGDCCGVVVNFDSHLLLVNLECCLSLCDGVVWW